MWRAVSQPYRVTARCAQATGNTLTIRPWADMLFERASG